MKIKTYYLILAITAVSFCAAVPGQTEQPLPDDKPLLINQPHPALAGIGTLHVVVLRYGTKQNEDVPFFKQIETDVNEKLRRDGIELDTPTADNISSIPELRIYVSSLSLEDSQQRIFHIRTALARAVCLKNEQNPVFKADIWQADPVMQTVSAENMPAKITDIILKQVEGFIYAYKATNSAAKQSSEAKISESDSPAAPENQAKAGTESAAAGFLASKSSSIFHKPECRWAKNISEQNLVSYTSKDEAIKAGKRPCKSCNP
jgi:hypothetical protein